MTPFERSIRDITAVYRQSKGLPPLETIPAFLLKPVEPVANWMEDE